VTDAAIYELASAASQQALDAASSLAIEITSQPALYIISYLVTETPANQQRLPPVAGFI
jgi:hypothetical protein